MKKNNINKINFVTGDIPINWDSYFMLQAMTASFRSKDPSTKVGAVIVDKYNHQLSMGYNGFVAGIDESKLTWDKDPSSSLEFQKYGYVVHAEANAILHAKTDLTGSTCFVTLFPCNECAKLIASKRIKEVVYLSNKHHDKEHSRIANKIFELSGIAVRQIRMDSNLFDSLNNHFKELSKNL